MLTPNAGRRLEVWGDPIAHSKSPVLHAAAYRTLGADWQYGRRQVDVTGFAAEFATLDETWRGLSLTMPLKEQAFAASSSRDRHAVLTGAVNTLLLGPAPAGFNTDVGGIMDALADAEISQPQAVRILGAGATAASALVAVSEIGADTIEIRARHPERARGLIELGARLGVSVEAEPLGVRPAPVDLTVATLPSGTTLDSRVAEPLAENGGALFDAAYAPWPSALGAIWGDASVVSGLGMLLHQAIRQVRIFHHGDPDAPLPGESSVIAAMRDAL